MFRDFSNQLTGILESNIRLKTVDFVENLAYGHSSNLIEKAQLHASDAEQIRVRTIERFLKRFPLDKQCDLHTFLDVLTIIAEREIGKIKRMRERNFGLSEAEFHLMVEKLKAGDETLLERVFIAHFKDCMALLKRKHSASHQDAYDATMDAVVIMCRKLRRGEVSYGNLRHLFTKIAVYRYIEWIRRERKTQEFTPLDLKEELPQYDDETLLFLDKAFAELGEGCQQLLQAFYYNENSLLEVAEATGRSYAAIRKQKQRCVEKLRTLFLKLI